MTKINVLNQGSIRLIDHMGGDEAIAQAARVLPDAEWRGTLDEKLINYMLNNRHTSPFEHVVFKFHVVAPIFVFRQWHRHRMWSYNEVSARYKEMPDIYFVPEEYTIGTQSSSNHQSRSFEVNPNAQHIANVIAKSCENSFVDYKRLLDLGCPRELARVVLPMSTYTEMIGTVDLHNLMHFIWLRSHEHAQFEIQVYSNAMLELITPYVPICASYIKKKMAP